MRTEDTGLPRMDQRDRTGRQTQHQAHGCIGETCPTDRPDGPPTNTSWSRQQTRCREIAHGRGFGVYDPEETPSMYYFVAPSARRDAVTSAPDLTSSEVVPMRARLGYSVLLVSLVACGGDSPQ